MPLAAGTDIQGRDFISENGLGRRIKRDAFVEVSVAATFIRADAPTLADAEMKAWNRYQEIIACGTHEYEPRRYTNGAGFCKKCNAFGSKVFSGEDLKQYCVVCGVGTTSYHYSKEAYWDANLGWIRDEGEASSRLWYCKEHAPFQKEIAESLKESREVSDAMTAEDIMETLNSIFTALKNPSSDKGKGTEEATLINDFE